MSSLLRHLRSRLSVWQGWVYERELKQILHDERIKPPFTVPNERPIEYAFAFRQISSTSPRDILDVGTGVTALPHLIANCGIRVKAIDNIRDYWESGLLNRHFWVEDMDVVEMEIVEEFDMVLCISTLEHIVAFDAAVNAMARSLRPGGSLVMTFPFTHDRFIENVYEVPGSDAPASIGFGAHSFSIEQVRAWENRLGLVRTDAEFWRFYETGPWSVGRRLDQPSQVTERDIHQHACFAWRKR